MSEEKAYKILAKQKNISNNEAKELIDSGLVYAKGQKVMIARALMSENTKFSVEEMPKPNVIFEDENLIAINKPAAVTSEKSAKCINFHFFTGSIKTQAACYF